MASTPSQGRLRRAILGLPILAAAAAMIHVFLQALPVTTPFMDKVTAAGRYEHNGIDVPLRSTFYGVAALDQLFSVISMAMFQLYSFADPVAYWQSLTFLVEFTAMYAIMLFESCRGSAKGTIFAYPFITAFAAQLASLGIMGPIYFYALHVCIPLSRLAPRDARRIDPSYAAVVLPAVVAGYTIPHLLSYLHPDLEARHWWNWIWQPYPMWCSALLLATAAACSILSPPRNHIVSVRIAVAVIALLNAAVFRYTKAASGMTTFAIFFPKHFIEIPPDMDTVFRTLLQYDWLCGFGASLLWLAHQLAALKSARLTSVSWPAMLLAGLTTYAVSGVGNVLLLGWWFREEVLVSWNSDSSPSKKKL
ncbi:hypothetical protein B0I35DRAFT_444044 [Stachybotrys elegans]|uniref:Uncharacterized protein n=1 Tax=Stachybotrys elegans TaxID=80388 RepID=A0A8K0WM55_9HYPO|nr:hypothetical protein B0I35DRAFT_444044 [Stachybotrys elegans]